MPGKNHKKNMRRDVVVFAGGIGSTYSICKILKRKYNVSIYLIFINETYASLFYRNRYVAEAVGWEIDSSACFMEKIKEWYAAHSFDERPVLYNTSDESCVLVAHDRKWFEERFVLTLPSSEIIRTYNNKQKSAFAVKGTCLKYPKTSIVSSEEEIRQVVESFSFPVIVKPFDFRSLKLLGFKVQVFNSKEKFLCEIPRLLSHRLPLLVQEYIPGDDDKSWFYIFYRGKDGRFLECMGRKVVQHPGGQGIMAVGRTVYNERLSRICRCFLTQINYTGIGGIEFKEHDGEYYFIEMSTRSEGFIRMSEAAGNFIPSFAYAEAIGEAIVSRRQNDGRFYVDVIIYVLECLKSRRWPFIGAVVNGWCKHKLAVNPYPFTYIGSLWKELKRKFVQ